MLRAYEDGGDSGLRNWMTQFFDDKYAANQQRSIACESAV